MSRIQISWTSAGVLRQTCMSRAELNLTIHMRYIYGTNATSWVLQDIKNSCEYLRNRCINEESIISGCPHFCTHTGSCYSCWGNAVEEFVLTGKDVPDL